MRIFRSMRLMLLALLIAVIPATSHAGVFISVGFAPPVLPVYVQPPCPTPGLMWTPGYWAYGPDGYYWVPGAWVPAPYAGALWTPGYWGWGGGLYAWHPGYWGLHVGYYGGVNYGFGYMGIGFAGGAWRGGVFAYNTAVMHVGSGGAWGGNRVYVDNTIVHNTTIINNTHVSYNGGPGGINHAPTAEENTYSHEPHVAATSFQTQHEVAARSDHGAYFNANHGHPANVVASRPLQAENHPMPENRVNNNRPTTENRVNNNTPMPENRVNNNRPMTEDRPATNNNYNRPTNTNNESRPAPESRPATQPHNQPKPENHESGGHDEHGEHGHGR